MIYTLERLTVEFQEDVQCENDKRKVNIDGMCVVVSLVPVDIEWYGCGLDGAGQH